MSRWVTTIAVVLAVVATALAGLKEQSESRRLQYDIPRLENRLQLLERRTVDAQTDVTHLCSPRSLLLELEHELEPLDVTSVPPTGELPR